jgi:hypothetical protein
MGTGGLPTFFFGHKQARKAAKDFWWILSAATDFASRQGVA